MPWKRGQGSVAEYPPSPVSHLSLRWELPLTSANPNKARSFPHCQIETITACSKQAYVCTDSYFDSSLHLMDIKEWPHDQNCKITGGTDIDLQSFHCDWDVASPLLSRLANCNTLLPVTVPQLALLVR
ncbi:predicted protein [Plenodomus lingam JN3]|uniref:Predicted protein n=1 Tax=Leptosphaeria maculans (strain JN3 / isolate v23.1.3 / race Av1-4-5-6-7-8) TaxID=985895 RepID=E5A4P5_LEPMJ|nr:predicted protein [Plenodomus lingam JN3]CBX98593.1 predicted protein [Plenodomus lingam JN3]